MHTTSGVVKRLLTDSGPVWFAIPGHLKKAVDARLEQLEVK
jgi:hypothetical protein